MGCFLAQRNLLDRILVDSKLVFLAVDKFVQVVVGAEVVAMKLCWVNWPKVQWKNIRLLLPI